MMVLKILIGLAVVIVVLVIVIATRPSKFHLERSIAIAAPPEVVFAQVNDFHAWTGWSPWEKMDPQLKRTYDGASSGAGAIYAWTGNAKVGGGRMTIQRSDRPSQIVIKLEFFKPWKATNTATFTFVPEAGGTKLTWAMDGTNNFMAKGFHMVMDFDKLVGADFERGLASIKSLAEADSRARGQAASATN
jgi:uncharacterized protein YndB with AHSA1/START domain